MPCELIGSIRKTFVHVRTSSVVGPGCIKPEREFQPLLCRFTIAACGFLEDQTGDKDLKRGLGDPERLVPDGEGVSVHTASVSAQLPCWNGQKSVVLRDLL